jgi:hypothetical protein
VQRRINTGDLNDHRKFDSHTLPPYLSLSEPLGTCTREHKGTLSPAGCARPPAAKAEPTCCSPFAVVPVQPWYRCIRSGYVPHYAAFQTYGPQYATQQAAVAQGSEQPVIEVNGKLQFSLPGQPLFPALADDTVLKPTLSWELLTRQGLRPCLVIVSLESPPNIRF